MNSKKMRASFRSDARIKSRSPLQFGAFTTRQRRFRHLTLYHHTNKKETQNFKTIRIMTTTTTVTLESTTTTPVSKGKLWTARIMGALVILFMLMDSIFKLIPNDIVTKGTVELGYQAHHIPVMGILGFISTLLFIIPRTQILGAILLTGYFGGAIATHVRLDNPLFSHILFPVYLGVLAWGSVWLKNENFRRLIAGKK